MNIGYVKKDKLGEGTYACIYLADQVETLNENKIIQESEEYLFKKKVAIKRIKKTDHGLGLEVSAIREIKALQKVKNKYVIELFDIFINKNEINLVLEYAESNLEILIKAKDIVFMPPDIKSWMLMILKGTYACHKKFVVHRDIKPNNILITASGVVKLADFGLSKDITGQKMTSSVVTRWYRAPELLMGAELYSFNIDVWSIGCIFAELFLRIPFFAADDDFKQLDFIFRALGTPTAKDWPGMTSFRNYLKYPEYPPTSFDLLFTAASEDALDLMRKMFVFDPLKRITCLNALKHGYFTNLPRPTSCEKLPYSK